jgi:hypothetical protein
LDIVKAINANAAPDRKVEDGALAGTFESMWPRLEEKFRTVPSGPEARERSDRELLEEVLELVRAKEPMWPSVSFSNVTPSASGPGDTYELERARLEGYRIGNRSAFLMDNPEITAGIPPKVIQRLRGIAGPDGLVAAEYTKITMQSPRVGADDFTPEEMMFLDTTRNFLEAMGMKLILVDSSNTSSET